MTTQQLALFNGLYLVVFAAVAFFTRATARRILGAVVGAVVAGIVCLGADALGERTGLWHMAIWEARLAPIVCLDFVISLMPIYLITWRIARRFGGRGLAWTALVLTVIGPPRDYAYMARFPEWGRYAPGIAPILAIAAIYASLIPLGHSAMRLAAGLAAADGLARRPWEAAKPGGAAAGGPTLSG